MEKLKTYVQENWKWIITSVFIGQCFPFWIIPYFLTRSWVQTTFTLKNKPSLTFHFIIIILFFLILLHAYKPTLVFWARYKNNFRLKKIPFTYIDSVFFFIASLITSLFHKEIRENISEHIGFLLIILGSLFFIWFALIIYKKHSYKPFILPSLPKLPSADFFPDEPITHKSEDLLGRRQFVEGLYNQIINYPFQDSFVFGLYGVWGEGKTSVLNLLKNKLQQNENIILFEFDPWYFSSQEALIKGFYDGLYSALNKTFFLPNIRTFFSKYHKILSAGVKLTGINIDIDLSHESLEELRKKIEEWISVIGKKIVILIDDIDRLESKNDILQTFKIIKLSGRFKNTIFGMSFDPKIISSFLKEEIPNDPSFLDKIIQNPIHLPATEQSDIDKFIYYSYPDENHYSAIDRLLQKLEIDQERIRAFEKEFNDLYETQIKKCFPTLRHSKRYLNGLYSTLPSVFKEVNLRDFLILELIRIFYSEVYEDIWKHPWFYVPPWNLRAQLISPLGFISNEKEKYQKIREHIEQIMSEQKEKEILLELLQTIFFVEVKNAFSKMGSVKYSNVSSYRSEKRITHPDVFPKYFMFKVPPRELPDEVVESLINSWNKTDPIILESKFIEDLRKFKEETKLLVLLERIRTFLDNLEPTASKSIIRSIYKNTHLFSGDRGGYLQSESDNAHFLMLHLINEKIEVNQIEPILSEVIKETPSFECAVRTVMSCHMERGGSFFKIYENAKIENLQKLLSERLAHHFIEGQRNIFEEETNTYGIILRHWGIENKESRQKVNEYVFSLIERNPKYLGKVIVRFLIDWGDPLEKQIEYNDLIKLYDETRLYRKVKENYKDAYSTSQEKTALDLFIKVYEDRQVSA